MTEVVWKPSEAYIQKANITRFMKKHDIRDYDELIKKSTDDIEWFWDAVMKDLNIEWFQPYTKVLDDSKGIQWVKWFIDGKINIVHNCLDRHARSNKKDNKAIIWENEKGKVRKFSFLFGSLKINVHDLSTFSLFSSLPTFQFKTVFQLIISLFMELT